MASDCASSPATACGEHGHCDNGSEIWKEEWICTCDYPWINIGDLNIDPTRKCEVYSPGVRIVWGLCACSWLFVLLCALITAHRLRIAAPPSAKRTAETTLLSLKAVHAVMFIVVALLEISSPYRVVGRDIATTVCYAIATTLFWIEYKLFLVLPTLSSVTALARVIAPRPMQLYTRTAPLLVALAILGNFSVLGMVFTEENQRRIIFGIVHVELSATIALAMLGSSFLAMTAILRKFRTMLSESNPRSNNGGASSTPIVLPSGTASRAATSSSSQHQQRSKIENVVVKIRQLRIETGMLIIVVVPGLIIYGVVAPFREWGVYLIGLVWSFAGLVTLRFIYMSHQTVQIHHRRNKTDGPSPLHQQPGIGGGFAENKLMNDEDEEEEKPTAPSAEGYTPFSSSIDSARHAISSMARRRKKRRPKFVNAMTRVEEERTAALISRADVEAFTHVETNEMSGIHENN